MEKELNVNFGKAITDLETALKKYLVKRIIYKILFRGKGLEFDSYREYAPDDDAGCIDWKASMRANKPLVRQYIEERDLKNLFVIDVGSNMVFGSTEKLKCEIAAEISAALSHLVMISGDRIGFCLFNEKIIRFSYPLPGKKQFFLFANHLKDAGIYKGKSDLKTTLDFLLRTLDSSISSVFIVSDFSKVNKELEKTAKLFSNRFETIALMIKDPRDITMPNIKEEIILEDPYTGRQILVNPSLIKKRYEKNSMEKINLVKKMFVESGADFLMLTTDKPFVAPLASFLKQRVESKRYISPTKSRR